MYYLVSIIRILFMIYTLMILIRVFGSWFPKFSQSTFMRFVAHYTDPYLNFFRRFIPPIGGRVDLSPLIAFIALRLVEQLIFMILL